MSDSRVPELLLLSDMRIHPKVSPYKGIPAPRSCKAYIYLYYIDIIHTFIYI